MIHDELKQRIGARIRQRRQELGLTQDALAGGEYTKSYISQVERGLIWPSLPSMIYIARRLDRSMDWFVGSDDAP